MSDKMLLGYTASLFINSSACKPLKENGIPSLPHLPVFGCFNLQMDGFPSFSPSLVKIGSKNSKIKEIMIISLISGFNQGFSQEKI